MAAGEYVSVSSQADTEQNDLAREKRELIEMPEVELQELAKIYEKRGLSESLAKEVAVALTNHNALEAHARDELGINEMTTARPLQAAFASFLSFLIGGVLPLIVSLLAPLSQMIIWQYGLATVFLVVLGTIAAKAGGSGILKSAWRIVLWGTIAMAVSAGVGYLFGVNMAG